MAIIEARTKGPNGASDLLDREGLVCDLPRAVVDQSELQAAQCWRTNFIFDPCDLHKLLVLEVSSSSRSKSTRFYTVHKEPDNVNVKYVVLHS